MFLNKIPLFILLFIFSCKDANIKNKDVGKEQEVSLTKIKTLKKENFVGVLWEDIDLINNTFKELKMMKKEERRYVKLLNNKEVIIVIMEPTKYKLDSIQETNNNLLLHIKGGNLFLKFKWIDKKRHIGRWDYIYNKTIIDSSFSMYVVDEKYIDDLSKN